MKQKNLIESHAFYLLMLTKVVGVVIVQNISTIVKRHMMTLYSAW